LTVTPLNEEYRGFSEQYAISSVDYCNCEVTIPRKLDWLFPRRFSDGMNVEYTDIQYTLPRYITLNESLLFPSGHSSCQWPSSFSDTSKHPGSLVFAEGKRVYIDIGERGCTSTEP